MYEDNMLSIDLKAMVDNEIGRDERLLWTGQPTATRFLLLSLPAVLFAIPWTGFAIFWIWGASGFGRKPENPVEWIFPLFGLPFVLIGLGMLSTPFWLRRKARKTVYAVTSRRVVVFVKGFSTKVTSYEIRKLTNMTKKIRSDGSGDLLFNESGSYGSNGDYRSRPVGFWGVENVNRVEDLIERARREDTE